MSHTRGGSVGEGQNVVRKSSKRSRIILGAAVASALAGMTASSVRATDYSWTGTAGGPSFWDANTSWSPNSGFPGSSDNATFGAGAVDFLVDLHATPQGVNNLTFNNATGAYQMANGQLNILGTFTQSGAATNTISAQVLVSGTTNVSGGSLLLTNTGASGNSFGGNTINVSSGATFGASGGDAFGQTSAAANGNVNLNGGTFRTSGAYASGSNTLLQRYYDNAVGQPTINPISNLISYRPSGGNMLNAALRFSDQGQNDPLSGPPFNLGPTPDVRTTSGGAITNDDNFSVLWTGTMTLSAANAGTYNWLTNSDDGSVVWIDRNNNGIYEQTADPNTNELIVDNNFFQGPTTRTGSVTLPAGTYPIAIAWYEGGVTGSVFAAFNGPATGNQDALVNPSDPAQAGIWNFTNNASQPGGVARYDADLSSTTVNVAAGTTSTVSVDALSTKIGALTVGNGATLVTNGNGPVSFASTKLNGIATFNPSTDTSTGTILTDTSITRLNKVGTGALILNDGTTPSGLGSTSTVSVQAGKLVARSDGTANAISGAGGAAKISLDGGTFVAATQDEFNNSGNALRARYYSGPNSTTLLDPLTNVLSLTPSHTNLLTGNLSASDNTTGTPIGTLSDGSLYADNFTVLWTGRINISAANAGRYIFSTRSDDGSVVFIDLNRDGFFDPDAGELIVNNNQYQGPTGRDNNNPAQFNGHSGHPDLDLAAGSYPIAIGWYEGGGGAEMTATIQGPATGGVQQIINPTVQNGIFSTLEGVGVANFSTSPVVVTADSAIDVQADHATFGDLTIGNGRTLSFPGVGAALFASTHATGTININNNSFSDVSPGRIFTTGPVTINKSGGGNLIIDDTSAASGLVAGSALNLTGGALIASHDGTNNALGSAAVTLTNAGVTLSSKTASAVTYNNSLTANGNTSVVAAIGGSNAVPNGIVTLATLNLGAGANVQVAANDGYSLTVPQTNLLGSATLNNSSSDTNIKLGNISGIASSVLTINGANRTRITGNATGQNIIINSPGVDLDPGSATTRNFNTNTTVNTEMRINSGIVDYGQNVISGNAAHFTAGLWEGRVNNDVGINTDNNNYNKSDPNPNQSIQLGLRRANQINVDTGGEPRSGTDVSGWQSDQTYIYTGQIFVADSGNGTGTIAFGENFDDWVQIKVDGQLKLEDINWNIPTSTGPMTLAAGWHDVEFRFGQGVGGVGPVTDAVNGWPGGTKAIAMNVGGTNSVLGTDYPVVLQDNGSMNLFRALLPTAGSVDVEAGTELRVGGITNLANVNLNGSAALAKLTLNNHTTASNSDLVNLNVVGGGSQGEAQIGTNTTLSATNVNVDPNASLVKSGPGTLRATGKLVNGGTITVSAGKLTVNGVGSGTGNLVVQSGGTIGGTGSISGLVQVNTGGSISPHDAAGTVATTTFNDLLNMDPAARLDFNFGTSSDQLSVLNNFSLTGNSILNINAIPGFTVGTYRLVTMTNFSDTGDITIGTNNGPGAFNYSIVETAPNGIDPGHIDLVVTTQTLKWTGTTNNVWDVNNTVNWQNAVPAPAKYLNLTAVVFDNNGTNRNINISSATGVSPASITVDNDAAHAYSITSVGANNINGNTGLTKRGVGTLSLSGPNSFLGPVVVEAGTLDTDALANVTANSPLGAGSVPLTLGSATTAGTLRYSGAAAGSTDRGLILAAGGGGIDNAQDVTISGIVSGGGSLTKSNAGVLNLTGTANTNTGSINVNAGTVNAASMGLGIAPAVIGLGSGTTFNYGGPTQTGGRGVTVAAGGGTIGVTNANTNLTLTGSVSGPTLNKGGTGTLTLAGPVTFTGTTHALNANSGTLAFTNTAAPNAITGNISVAPGSTLASVAGGIGTSSIALNGGTLRLTGTGLTGQFYQFAPPGDSSLLNSLDDFHNQLASQTLQATASTILADRESNPVGTRGAINNNAGNGNPFSQYGVVIGTDNIIGRWSGKINITPDNAGDVTFFTASDDGSKLWVDGVEVVNNNFFQGVTERSGVINLTPGLHDIEMGFYEGGGGAGMIVSWQPTGKQKVILPNSILFPSAVATTDFSANSVSVAPALTSTIQASGPGKMGALSLGAGSTLRVTDGNVSFSGSTLATSGAAYNLDTTFDINLGGITGTGTINKTSSGSATVETANLAGPGAGSVFNVNGGTLRAVGQNGQTNPLGAATVNLANGGGLTLSSRNGDVTFDTPVNATGTVRIAATPAGSGVPGVFTMSLGGTNALTLAPDTTVVISRTDNNRLRLANTVLNGNATIQNTSTNVAGTIVNVNSTVTGNTLNFTGTTRTRIAGTINAGQIVINNASGSAAGVNTGGGVYSEPEAGTTTVNAPAKIISQLDSNFGTLTFGSNILTGQKMVSVAGIRESWDNGGFQENGFTPHDQTITLGLPHANMPSVDTTGRVIQGWADNRTYIYQGQFFVKDNDVPGDHIGLVSWAEQFDDNVLIRIDGVQQLRDTAWNVATATPQLALSVGWHDIDIRVGQGGGGVGASGQQGFPGDYGVVFDPNGSGSTDPSQYIKPVDPGDGSFFRVITQNAGGTINVASNATLTAGGVDDMVAINLSGAIPNLTPGTGPAVLNLVSPTVRSGHSDVLTAQGAVGQVNTVNLGANNTLNVNNLTVNTGTIFNKEGGGTLRVMAVPNADALGIANNHDFQAESEIHVNAGKLIVDTAGTTGGGSVFVANGATIGGSGGIAGSVAVSSGGHVAPGDGVGTLTVGGMSADSSIFDIEGSALGLDKLKVASDGSSDVFTLTGNNVITLSDLGGVALQDYVVIDYNNATPIADALSHLTISNPDAFNGLHATLFNDTANQDIVIQMIARVGNPEWKNDASGSWGVATNWIGNTVPDAANAVALFKGAILAPRTVTLDGNRTVQNMTFDNANKYTIASGTGGTLTLAGGGGIIVEATGSHEISAPVALAGVNTLDIRGGLTMSGGVSIGAGGTTTKTGAGALTISGAAGHGTGAALTVNQGVVNLNSNQGTAGSSASSKLALNVVGGAGTARVNLGSNQDLASLNVQFGDAGTQTLDLNSGGGAGAFHSVTVYAANVAAAKASLWSAIVNANKTGAADPADGIIDSSLHSASGIGLSEVTGGLEIRSTRIGDVNLDGNVSIADFLQLAGNFGTVGTATWQEGDVNYDRNVSIADFLALAGNFGSSYAGSVTPVSASDMQTLSNFASSIGADPSVIGSAVPEPGTLSLLAVGAMGLMARRRRKA